VVLLLKVRIETYDATGVRLGSLSKVRVAIRTMPRRLGVHQAGVDLIGRGECAAEPALEEVVELDVSEALSRRARAGES
jgi:hypothetical protein